MNQIFKFLSESTELITLASFLQRRQQLQEAAEQGNLSHQDLQLLKEVEISLKKYEALVQKIRELNQSNPNFNNFDF